MPCWRRLRYLRKEYRRKSLFQGLSGVGCIFATYVTTKDKIAT